MVYPVHGSSFESVHSKEMELNSSLAVVDLTGDWIFQVIVVALTQQGLGFGWGL